MDSYEINILEFSELLKKENYSVYLINDYFENKINKKIPFSKKEIKRLEALTRTFKMTLNCSREEKKRIFQQIEMLLVLSKDISNFDHFKEIVKRKTTELTEDEIIEYLNILINNCLCCLSISKIESLIQRYIEISDDIDKISNFILENSSIFSKKTLKQLNECIYNKRLSIILNQIFEELNKEQISIELIYQYFNQISEFKVEKISNKNILLFRKVLIEINNNNLFNNIYYLKEKINYVFNKLVIDYGNETKIMNDIISGNIELTNCFPKLSISNLDLSFEYLPISEEKRIITIDDPLSPDLDGAFSIKKVNNESLLTVFISDVPVFLSRNKELCKEAYLRGTSMYIRNLKDGGNYNIDMLPQFLSHKYLSLNLGYPKRVIAFKFLIKENGEIYICKISREKIIVTNKLSPQETQRIIELPNYGDSLQSDLKYYKNLCELVSKKSSDEYLKKLNCNNISDLVAFSSILVNYYIGHNSEFAIYRENGSYTKNSNNYYTHSVTPIRKFVSDINLAFFLEQNGVVSFPDKDLNYVETNIEEIIAHFNSREEISKVVEKNSKFVKKYIR